MSRFEITIHTISASHQREYPRATIAAGSAPPELKLVVNQYVPLGYTAAPGDVSIIFCHANGCRKVPRPPFCVGGTRARGACSWRWS